MWLRLYGKSFDPILTALHVWGQKKGHKSKLLILNFDEVSTEIIQSRYCVETNIRKCSRSILNYGGLVHAVSYRDHGYCCYAVAPKKGRQIALKYDDILHYCATQFSVEGRWVFDVCSCSSATPSNLTCNPILIFPELQIHFPPQYDVRHKNIESMTSLTVNRLRAGGALMYYYSSLGWPRQKMHFSASRLEV